LTFPREDFGITSAILFFIYDTTSKSDKKGVLKGSGIVTKASFLYVKDVYMMNIKIQIEEYNHKKDW
jgi:hypothetical protein